MLHTTSKLGKVVELWNKSEYVLVHSGSYVRYLGPIGGIRMLERLGLITRAAEAVWPVWPGPCQTKYWYGPARLI